MKYLTREFWSDTFGRAIRTAAQAAVLALAVNVSSAPDGTNLLDALGTDWARVGSFALGGAILATLTALAASQVGEKGTTTFLSR